MIILALRTDRPEAEIALYEDNTKLAYETWQAHRQLAETLHLKIQAMLESAGNSWQDIGGVVVYEGPGSFTGLRIGISVANSIAYSNSIQVVGCSGNDWLENGISKIASGKGLNAILPVYGSEAHITSPKK